MEKSKLAKFLDNLVLSICILILSFLIFQKYFRNYKLSIICAVVASAIIIKIITSFQFRRLKKLGLEKEEIKNIEKLNFYIRSQTQQSKTLFLKRLFQDEKPIVKNGFILTNSGVAIANYLNKNEVTEEQIFEIISKLDFLKKLKITEVALIVNQAPKNLKTQLDENIKLCFITPDIFYAIVRQKNLLPNFSTEKTQKVLLKHRININFAKNQAKHFFRIGIVIFAMSFFIPFAKYYLILSIVCFVISAIMLVFGKKPIEGYKTKLLNS